MSRHVVSIYGTHALLQGTRHILALKWQPMQKPSSPSGGFWYQNAFIVVKAVERAAWRQKDIHHIPECIPIRSLTASPPIEGMSVT
jgi:hypothetical protein